MDEINYTSGSAPLDASTATIVAVPPKADYQPLQLVKVPGAQIVPKGLVLVVGPNSAGKTQFLKDIHALLAGEQRKSVVCDQILINKPTDLNDFLDGLVEHRYVRRFRDSHGQELLSPTAPFLGFGPTKTGNTYFHQIQTAFANLQPGAFTIHNNQSAPFFNTLGHSFVTSLFLDRRLTIVNETPSFDYESSPPTNEMQSLFIDKKAKKELSQEVKQVFGKGIWLDNSRSNILCLRVNQKPEIPSPEERIEPQDMKQYRTIESEGDGLRSYVGICVSLLLGLRPVCLIDEPELCLHPPQAYQMGLFIGRHGSAADHAIFASTHSSHVLRGVIESTNQVQILRLTKYGDNFKGHLIGPSQLTECMDRPMVRAETILDGIFADGVALVEADGDRAVYQAAWESITEGRTHPDVLFVPVGGTGGFAEIAGFYRSLQIPVAVIADLDLIRDPGKLRRILGASYDKAKVTEILKQCREVTEYLQETPPQLTEADVKGNLQALLAGQMSWAAGDDVRLRQSLNQLSKQIDRLGRLKAGGVEGLRDAKEVFERVVAIVQGCRSVGVFLVPPGEVENWQPAGVIDAPSKDRKAEWANWAASHIRRSPDDWTELCAFMESIKSFEAEEARRLAIGQT